MTVIAWDGTTLAADRLASFQGLKRTTIKIKKVRGNLLASSGNASECQEMFRWFENGADPEKYPKCQDDKDRWVSLNIINPQKEIWVYEQTPTPFQCFDKQHAIGGGRDYALAAMYMGADAVKAVEVASHFETGCGLGIDTLTLED